MIKEERITGSLLIQAHELVARVLKVCDTVVDATLGNGHDTLFLAECVGASGMVVGFDIQETALCNTGERLESAGIDSCCYKLICESHADIARHVKSLCMAVMFNLGYLPGGDKAKITHGGSTLTALLAAVNQLSHGGILTVMCYPGHEGGADEALVVTDFIGQLDDEQWCITRYNRDKATHSSPYLWVVTKNRA
mgnify:FL=1